MLYRFYIFIAFIDYQVFASTNVYDFIQEKLACQQIDNMIPKRSTLFRFVNKDSNSCTSINSKKCHAKSDSCEFYTCLDTVYSECNNRKRNYAWSYGYYYCQKFRCKTKSKLTKTGKKWLENTTYCLQKKLEDSIDNKISCSQLKKLAFNSHLKCYLGQGPLPNQNRKISLCELPIKDKISISKTIQIPDMISKEGSRQIRLALSICGSQYYKNSQFYSLCKYLGRSMTNLRCNIQSQFAYSSR